MFKLALGPTASAWVMVAIGATACSANLDGEGPTDQSADALISTQEVDFGGASLADHKLSLTFDDGPGERTGELSAYLKAQGIRGTFFINGMQVNGANLTAAQKSARAALLAQLSADGHLIGNHTQDHADLYASTPAKIRDQIAKTDTVITTAYTRARTLNPALPAAMPFLFRAPFGDWDNRTYNAVKGTALDKYTGHIGWDHGGDMSFVADFDCWDPEAGTGRTRKTTAQCGELYLKDIETRGVAKRGIVLMHDPYGRPGGNTVDMVKYIVPKLKQRGYTFVRTDEVPDVRYCLALTGTNASRDKKCFERVQQTFWNE